ncbi:MAG: LysR family transcriptional regulator [Kiloniellales bacterium]|nr:LysR family transcriptional regulator [Kiloniellales bacterium]
MDHLVDMALFARVAELESFSGAARDLGLSKSAVSKRIARLEDRLGLRLLNRTTRRLSLTEAGTAFYDGCRRVVAEAEAASEAVSHLATAPRGTLRVNAPMSFGMLHVAPCLADFMARYPELKVEMVFNDRMVDLVEEGFDVGIRITPLPDSSVISRRLAPARLVVAAAPSYLAAKGWPETPDDLTRHEALLYAYRSGGDRFAFASPGGRRTISLEGRLRANNGEALATAAVGGLGIAIQPSFILAEALRAGLLEPLLTDWTIDHPDVHAVYPASRNLSPKVRVFVDFLAERFGDTPYWERGLGEAG